MGARRTRALRAQKRKRAFSPRVPIKDEGSICRPATAQKLLRSRYPLRATGCFCQVFLPLTKVLSLIQNHIHHNKVGRLTPLNLLF